MSDARAMQKLFKEAGRVKQVLSANTDHFAQVAFFVHFLVCDDCLEGKRGNYQVCFVQYCV